MQITDEQVLERLQPAVKRKSKGAFKSQWVKLPVKWVEALRRSTSASTYRLALIILIEAFKLCPISSSRGSVGEGYWQQVAAVHRMMQDRFQPLLKCRDRGYEPLLSVRF